MIKQLVTFLVLINIFVGYFAEAYQGESSDCDSNISQQLNHTSQDSQSSDSPSSSDKQCLGSHCLFGQCAAIKQTHVIKLYLGETPVIEFNSNN